jgi:hypothetical protein
MLVFYALLFYRQTPLVKQKKCFIVWIDPLSHFSISDIAFFIFSVLIKFLAGLFGLKKGAMFIAFFRLPNDIFPLLD